MKVFITIILTLLFAFSVFTQRQAEVIVTSTYLRKLPDSTAEKVQTVQNGEKITFEKTQDRNGWYYVSILNGTVKGWIRKDTVRSLAKTATVNQKPQKIVIAATPVVSTQASVIGVTPVKIETPSVSVAPPESATPTGTRPSSAPAETPVVNEEVLRVDTEEISLNVRVVNSNNRPVKNLNQAQFEVYEDNVVQPITSFTTAEVPVINALVIDNSRSLRSQLGKVIEAGKIIVGTNRPKDETTIVRFVSKDKIEVVQDFTTNKNSLNNALDNLFVEGGQTAIIDAVYQTAKKVEEYQNSQKKEDVKLRSLILVSDGDDRGSFYKEQQLFQLLRESNVQIYAVGFVSGLSSEADANNVNRREKARAFLTRLAQETGGKVFFPDSINDLAQIASDISGELRTQYLISYTPTNENRDGSFRKINVVIREGADKEKRIAITRTGRTSVPQ